MSDDLDDFDEPDEPYEQGDEFATLHVTRRPTDSNPGAVQAFDLTAVDWPALIPAAVNAETLADFHELPFPAGLDDAARAALAVWCRHPVDYIGMLNWRGTHVCCDTYEHTPATETDPGDVFAYELLGEGSPPIYPHWEYSDRPVVALLAAWAAMAAGEPVELDDVADWWPATLTVDRRKQGKTWVDIDAANGAPISHTLLGTARFHDADGEPPPAGARGKPLKTLDYDNALGVVVEQVRRAKSPTRSPVGRPPDTRNIIAVMTPAERLAAAIALVEQHGSKQTAAAAALGVRTDSLNRAIKRRQRRRR